MIGKVCLLALVVASWAANLTARSSSKCNDLAQFLLNDMPLPVATGPGLNVVVLGSEAVYHSFGEQDDLGSFLGGLPNGSLVLAAAQFSPAAMGIGQIRAALAEKLGAKKASNITAGGAYALVAITGRGILAESVSAGGSPASASASYSLTASVSELKPLRSTWAYLELQAFSAGRQDGNWAKFAISGRNQSSAASRGLNLVLVDPRGFAAGSRTFDTWGSGSAALISYIGALPEGQIVLVAAMDDGFTNLTAGARAALGTLGAGLIQNLTYRASYALVGIKGGQRLCEGLAAAGKGPVSIRCFLQQPSWMAIPLQALGGGRLDGSFVEFAVNGSTVPFQGGRGINAVVLAQNGSVVTAQHFDTYANPLQACRQLAQLLYPLPIGSPVLISTQADAGKLTADCFAAVAGLGALSLAAVTGSSSYSLVGRRGLQALSESVVHGGCGIAQAVAAYRQVPIPAARPLQCAYFPCAVNQDVRLKAWNATKLSQASCCSDLGNQMGLKVVSGGFVDGNTAQFFVNGFNLVPPTRRGINIAVLSSYGTLEHFKVFDTHLDATQAHAMAVFLQQVTVGTLVLVALQDEGSVNVTAEAKTALEACGARQLNISFRDSYALIGRKGSASPLAEMHQREGSGAAVVLARMDLPTTSTSTSTSTTATTVTSTSTRTSTAFSSTQLQTTAAISAGSSTKAKATSTSAAPTRSTTGAAQNVTGTLMLFVQDPTAFVGGAAGFVAEGLAQMLQIPASSIAVFFSSVRRLAERRLNGFVQADFVIAEAAAAATGLVALIKSSTTSEMTQAILKASKGSALASGLQVSSMTASIASSSSISSTTAAKPTPELRLSCNCGRFVLHLIGLSVLLSLLA